MKLSHSSERKKLQAIGDRLDLAELLWRGTDGAACYEAMAAERIAYKECLDMIEAQIQCTIVEARSKKVSAATVLNLHARMIVAADHRAAVAKIPSMQIPQRELIDAAARGRLSAFRYGHALAAYGEQCAALKVEHAERHKNAARNARERAAGIVRHYPRRKPKVVHI
jgi:hypothetical protein